MEGHGHYAYAGYPLLPPSRLTGTPPDCSCAQETIPTGTIPITEAPKARLGEVPPGSSPIFICTLHPLGVGSCFGDFQPSGPLTSFLEWTGVSPCLQGASLCLPEAVRQQGCAILSSSRGSFLCGWRDQRGKGLASGDRLSVSVHPRRGSVLQSQWDDRIWRLVEAVVEDGTRGNGLSREGWGTS